jgi:hypothetical protein
VSKKIPTRSRDLVRGRSHGRCERCGVPAPAGQWHHRRRRRVSDEHTHCPCNGVWLCPTCHRQVHVEQQVQARLDGWIVSAYVSTPGGVPVLTPWGSRRHNCDGTINRTAA